MNQGALILWNFKTGVVIRCHWIEDTNYYYYVTRLKNQLIYFSVSSTLTGVTTVTRKLTACPGHVRTVNYQFACRPLKGCSIRSSRVPLEQSRRNRKLLERRGKTNLTPASSIAASVMSYCIWLPLKYWNIRRVVKWNKIF